MTSIPLNPFLVANKNSYVGSLDRVQSFMFVELLIAAGATGVMAANITDERVDKERE